MIGSVRLDGARGGVVTNAATLAAIDRFGSFSETVGTAAALRLAALQDTIARQTAAPGAYYAGAGWNASGGVAGQASFEIGRQLGAAAATFLGSETGKAAFAKVLGVGEGILRDFLGLGPAASGGAAAGGVVEGAAGAAEAAAQLALPLVA